MKILFFHPVSSTNLGDSIILAGTERLLSLAFGSYEPVYFDIILADRNELYIDHFDLSSIDVFIVSGTPWIWDMCHQSQKYKLLLKITKRFRNDCLKIGLGLGSCFPLASNVMDVYVYQQNSEGVYEITREHTREWLVNIFGSFDFVSTRDRLAYHILHSIGVSVEDSICPAAFIQQYVQENTSPKKPLLIFVNPYDAVSRESCDNIFLDDYIQFQKWFKETYNPDIITLDPLSRDWCDGQKWNSKWMQNIEDGAILSFARIVKNSSFVVSGKVHGAIPAALWGVRSYILPMDTRYLACVRLGVTPVWTLSDKDWWMLQFTEADDEWKNKVQEVTETNKQFLVSKLQGLL